MSLTDVYEEQIFLFDWKVVTFLALFILLPVVIWLCIGFRKQAPGWALVLMCVFQGLVVFVMVSMHLYIRIDVRGVTYRYFPLQWKSRTVLWTEIEHAYCRIHDAVSEYGEWGAAGTMQDRAYTTHGIWGLQIILQDQRRLLISISDQKKVAQVLSVHLKERKRKR